MKDWRKMMNGKAIGFFSLILTAILAGGNHYVLGSEDKNTYVAADGNKMFAVDLYKQLMKKPGNLFFSPYSISSALAMTYAGARGDTETEMAKVLHFTLGQKGIHKAMGDLNKDFNSRTLKGRWRGDPNTGKKPFELVVANALWGQQGFGIEPAFLDLTGKHYEAGLRELYFGKKTEPSRVTINEWVAKKTMGKIQDLIARGKITSDTRLVLTNAIYFKSEWEEHFYDGATGMKPFHLTPDKSVPVRMMRKLHAYKHLEGKNFNAVSVAYAGKELSMVVFVPKTKDGLGDLEQALTPQKMENWVKTMKYTAVDLSLPSFEISSEFSLEETLPAMGMKAAFSSRLADFSGIAPKGRLFISDVIHKAFVKVDEKGTEAAGATAVFMKGDGPRKELDLVIDRPFLFLIRDNETGSVLFMGRVNDPRG